MTYTNDKPLIWNIQLLKNQLCPRYSSTASILHPLSSTTNAAGKKRKAAGERDVDEGDDEHVFGIHCHIPGFRSYLSLGFPTSLRRHLLFS